MTDIQYNFANNFSSLDEVSNGLNQIAEAQNDVAQVFNKLNAVFDGQTAEAFNALHAKINSQFTDLDGQMRHTTSQAVDQQNLMQGLDNKHAAQF